MKLKKIASLALAGIMAVSMLAGCGEGTNQEDPSSSGQVPTTTNVVTSLMMRCLLLKRSYQFYKQ